jgi:glycosyltransferase involved in cell wall biosynthesis
MQATDIIRAENATPQSHDMAARLRPRVLHLITKLDIGGTERQAVELLNRLDPARYDVRLAVIRRGGPFYQEIADRFPDVPEFPLTSLYNRNALKQLLRLRALLLNDRIDILHAHDFYASVMGTVAARSASVRVIAIWVVLLLNPDRPSSFRMTTSRPCRRVG